MRIAFLQLQQLPKTAVKGSVIASSGKSFLNVRKSITQHQFSAGRNIGKCIHHVSQVLGRYTSYLVFAA